MSPIGNADVQAFLGAGGPRHYPKDDQSYACLLAAMFTFPLDGVSYSWPFLKRLPRKSLAAVFEEILGEMEEDRPDLVRVLRLRFNLKGGEGRMLTLEEVAVAVGLAARQR